MDLRQEIKKLVVLQEIDSEIYICKAKKDQEIPHLLNELTRQFEKKKLFLSQYEEKVKKLQLAKKDKELDLATKEEILRKAQGQLYQLKTNKEYKAKLQEIESLKADISILEEAILKIMDELESAEKECNMHKEELSQEEKHFKENERELKTESAQLESEIKQFEAKKEQLAQEVDKNLLNEYDRLIKTRGGVAIAPVENENCGACHMRVTAQTINEIKMFQRMIYCESCIRMLYVKEDLE